MQIRDQLATTEKLEKQIKVLEQRKERALFLETQQRKVKDGVRKDSEKVKEEQRKNREFKDQQDLMERQIKKAKVEQIKQSKGRGIQVKESLVLEVQQTVAQSQEIYKMEHAQKLRIQSNEVTSLEEIEQQMVRKLKNTQARQNNAMQQLQKLTEDRQEQYTKKLEYRKKRSAEMRHGSPITITGPPIKLMDSMEKERRLPTKKTKKQYEQDKQKLIKVYNNQAIQQQQQKHSHKNSISSWDDGNKKKVSKHNTLTESELFFEDVSEQIKKLNHSGDKMSQSVELNILAVKKPHKMQVKHDRHANKDLHTSIETALQKQQSGELET